MKEISKTTGVNPQDIDLKEVPNIKPGHRIKSNEPLDSKTNLNIINTILSKSELSPEKQAYVIGIYLKLSDQVSTFSEARDALAKDDGTIFEDNPERGVDLAILGRIISHSGFQVSHNTRNGSPQMHFYPKDR